MAGNNTNTESLFLPKTALPNILDSFSSYTYNITFSALPRSFNLTGEIPIGTALDGSANKVIIAQTGVTTKYNIDNLNIESVVDTYGDQITKAIGTKIDFTITEPLGSSFITLLQVANNVLRKIDKKILSKEQFTKLYTDKATNKVKGPLDLPYLIEVDLIGHRDWSEDDTALLHDNEPSQQFEIIGK